MFSPDTPYPMKERSDKVIFLKNFIKNPKIEVGDYTYYHDMHHPEKFEEENIILLNECRLKIGKFCQIAHGTKFIMADANHPMSGFSTFPFFVYGEEWGNYTPDLDLKGDTIIGNDVWFGHQSTIMPAVTIGNGAIIGAKSVVTKDVPAYTIVGGNPAKQIRQRFSDDVIKELEKIAWWDWDYEKISRNLQAITGADIQVLKNAT